MPELLIQSDLVAATARSPRNVAAQGAKVRYLESRTTTTGTTGTNGSTYLVARLPSNARILRGSILGVGSIDLSDFDVGVRQVAPPNTLVDGAFATALDIDDTGDHLFMTDTATTQDSRKQMWEWAGLTADPGGMFDIHGSLDADATAAGVFVCRAHYVVD